MEIWTQRVVQFTPFPVTRHEKWNEFYAALPEKYWDRWYNKFMELQFGSRDLVIEVTGFPWWVSRLVALRMITRLAAKTGLEGDAEYRIIRTTMREL